MVLTRKSDPPLEIRGKHGNRVIERRCIIVVAERVKRTTRFSGTGELDRSRMRSA